MAAASSLAELRAKIELDLRGRVVSPFNYRDRNVFEVVSTGIPSLDAVVGGLPRGAMTEICGPPCSGRTSVLLSALAARTAEGETCTLIDARDSFDPAAASAAGVALEQVLWVRCQNADQALRATDLLIQGGRIRDGGGGFERCRAEDCAVCAAECLVSVSSRGGGYADNFDGDGAGGECEDVRVAGAAAGGASGGVERDGESSGGCDFLRDSMGRLFRGFEIGADVVRTRVQDVNEVMAINKFSSRKMGFESGNKQERVALFKAATNWSEVRG